MLVKDKDQYNLRRLGNYRLPVIESINDLLDLFNIKDRENIYFYSKNRAKLYTTFSIPKRGGGERIIEAPRNDLKEMLKLINEVMLGHFDLKDYCCAYRKGMSIVDNALPHAGAKTLLKFDIKDFFPSITLKQVVKLFRYFGYGINVSKYLGYMCVNGNCVLPQGSPTSPMLSNLINVNLDSRIYGYCKKHFDEYFLKYTRYADDITISSSKKLTIEQINRIKKVINTIIETEGYTPNVDKFKWFYNGKRLSVTGININHTSKLHADKKRVREVEKAIYFIGKYGLDEHLLYLSRTNNINWNKHKYINHIFGVANYIKMIDATNGLKLIGKLRNVLKNYE